MHCSHDWLDLYWKEKKSKTKIPVQILFDSLNSEPVNLMRWCRFRFNSQAVCQLNTMQRQPQRDYFFVLKIISHILDEFARSRVRLCCQCATARPLTLCDRASRARPHSFIYTARCTRMSQKNMRGTAWDTFEFKHFFTLSLSRSLLLLLPFACGSLAVVCHSSACKLQFQRQSKI